MKDIKKNCVNCEWKEISITKKALIFIGFAFMGIFLLWRVPYGAGGADESFYLAITHRLTMGDALLSEEWNLTQLSSLFLYPIMKIYLSFFSLDGILLSFRYIYVVIKLIISIVIFALLRRYSITGSFFASAIFMLFASYNMYVLSYNTMGVAFVALFSICYVNGFMLNKNYYLFAGGLFLACAGLCNPCLVSLYVIVMLINIIGIYKTSNRFWKMACLWITLGCIIVGLLFIAFVLSRASILEIIKNIPLMMPSNIEYSESPLSLFRYTLQNMIVFYYPIIIVSIFALFVTLFNGGIVLFKKKISKQKTFAFAVILWVAVYIINQLKLVLINELKVTSNFIMLPLAVVLPLVFIALIKNKRLDKLSFAFALMWLFGVIYGIAGCMSSNQTLGIFSQAMTISSMATIMLLFYIVSNLVQNEKYSKQLNVACIILVVVQIIVQLYSIITFVYWDDNLNELNVKLLTGPYKGAITSQRIADKYNGMIQDLDYFKGMPKDGFVYFSIVPAAYLYVDMPYATYSAWSGDFAPQCRKEKVYWELHPDKKPKYIYVEKQYIENLEDIQKFATDNNFSIEELNFGYALCKLNFRDTK